MPYIADVASHMLQVKLKPLDTNKYSADAIVVLGDGTYFYAPEYGGTDTVNKVTLMRLRYAAKLWRETGKPIMVVGGKLDATKSSLAQQMESVLENEFFVPVGWKQDNSENLLENANYCYQMLKMAGIERIYLVTNAWQMSRSFKAFQANGLIVIPAPLYFASSPKIDARSFIPNSESLTNVSMLIDEFIVESLSGFDFSDIRRYPRGGGDVY